MSAQSSPRATKVFPTLDVEHELISNGADFVVGFDEVGRGALAGPVMVGAVIVGTAQVKSGKFPTGLADSKMLTEIRREALYEPLQQWASAWSVGAATNKEIDSWGLAQALGIAALRALFLAEQDLSDSLVGAHMLPDLADAKLIQDRFAGILDGSSDFLTHALSLPDAPKISVTPAITTLVKADQRCASVAAASVLAKVTRDRIMENHATQSAYSYYGWEKNKGYGSHAHRAAIKEYGPSDLHRMSWHLT